jgi:hypothetical protein
VTLHAAQHRYGSALDLIEDYHERGWTDGLPIVPPTPDLVEACLAAVGLDPEEILGDVPSWAVSVDAERVAINAVMAGCLPAHMPVVVAAVRAVTRPEQNVHSATATLASNYQAVIVNGPIRRELGIACEQGCMGPGFRANASIGRALRLVIRNVLRAIPGGLDRSFFSTPGRYSFCFGENEEAGPWLPLSAERGIEQGQNAVTVFTVFPPVGAGGHPPTPEGIMEAWIARLHRDRTIWMPISGRQKDVLIVVGEGDMRVFVEAGMSKHDVREWMWAKLSVMPGRRATPEHPEPVLLTGPESILLVAAGGPGAGSQLFVPHVGRASTEPVLPALT